MTSKNVGSELSDIRAFLRKNAGFLTEALTYLGREGLGQILDNQFCHLIGVSETEGYHRLLFVRSIRGMPPLLDEMASQEVSTSCCARRWLVHRLCVQEAIERWYRHYFLDMLLPLEV